MAVPAPGHHEPEMSALTYGLIFGPGLGLLVALVFGGADAIAAGLVFGAAAGVAVGAVVDAQRERRSR